VFEAGNVNALLQRLRSFCGEFQWDRAVLLAQESARLSGVATAERFAFEAQRLIAVSEQPATVN